MPTAKPTPTATPTAKPTAAAVAVKPAAAGSLSAALAQVRSAAAGGKVDGAVGGATAVARPRGGAKAAPALIVSDGRLPSALAVWLEGVCRPAAGRAVVWHVPGLSPAALRVAEALATRAGVTVLANAGQSPNMTDATDVLLAAGRLALAQGLGRVVWPVLATEDGGEVAGGAGAGGGGLDEQAVLARTADVLDRALLVGRLLSIDAQVLSGGAVRSLTIETPLVDLTDVQLLDLFADSDAPLTGAMVCQAPAATPGQWTAGPTGGCGRCGACRRWTRAMREAGLA
ncbi:MAG: hypothetical protein LW650_09915 [Planctomycetaceae bacterium]|jgi:hypothetical protein|nr:7-cyano-7-deazaguanine synthase [Phycisphaerales bacterium]MCE2653779.1 hypothetical protein [Planctomycetaceae bacterium]